VSALAQLPATAQTMPRGSPPVTAMPSNMLRPQINPNAAFLSSFSGFRSLPNGMMAYPGMYASPSYGAASMPYSVGMGGYGGGMPSSSYGGQGSGSQGSGYPETRGNTGARLEISSEEKSLSRVLAASGVPYADGRLLWPVGLRVLRGGATDELRGQIDALFQAEAEQTQTGAVNPDLAQELTRSLDALRKFLRRDREERFSLPLAVYEDAESFLAKLDHAQKVLGAGLEPPGGKVRLEARQGNGDEVGLYDNRFDPPTLIVSAGTTVRWTNQGHHKHTVTSDSGDWGSKGLEPEGIYLYTFPQPGTYTYHCEMHPAEMRGTIVVK